MKNDIYNKQPNKKVMNSDINSELFSLKTQINELSDIFSQVELEIDKISQTVSQIDNISSEVNTIKSNLSDDK